ncbi:MAG: ABC transporter ATP-binding protein [Pseudomonadota bacterium]
MSVIDQQTRPDAANVSWRQRGSAAGAIAGRLSFEHVSRSFNDTAAVNDVSLDMQPGETLCLLGPSGCGKTTLLRLAAGVDRPTAGRVILDDQEIAGPDTFVPAEQRGIGLMFQDFALFPHLTILQNVAFGLRKLERSKARDEALLALKRVGLERYAGEYPDVLSGGEQQRVALARAIVPQPAVLLMDEPFSGLDQRLRDEIRAETLALLKETRATCMLVTHDPQEAMWLADRIALMREGRLVQLGTPNELYNHPVDVEAARFFSDFNEFDVTVEKKKLQTPVGTFASAGVASEGGPAHVMVRPQGIVLASAKAKSAFEATVSRVRFVGECTYAFLTVKGYDQQITARLASAAKVTQGEVRKFSVLPEHLLIFSGKISI